MKAKHLIALILIISCLSCHSSKQKNESISTNVTFLDSLINQSDSLYKNNHFEDAIVCYNKIVLLDSSIGEIFYRRGFCKAQISMFSESNDDYMRAIDLGCQLSNSYFNMGCNYAALLKDSMALESFSKAYELNENNKKAEREMKRFKWILDVK